MWFSQRLPFSVMKFGADDYATSLLLRDTAEARDAIQVEVLPISMRISTGDVTTADRAYLSSLVAKNAGSN